MNTTLKETNQPYEKDRIVRIRMVKTDSFMKESQCFNPPPPPGARTTFRRLVRRDVTLSDGKFLPKRILLGVDRSVRYEDLGLWENPRGVGWLTIPSHTLKRKGRRGALINLPRPMAVLFSGAKESMPVLVSHSSRNFDPQFHAHN